MIRRPPRSTLSSSSAASDVYKRQVGTRLQDFATGSWTVFAPEMRLVSVNAAPFDAVKHGGHAITGDALANIEELEARLGGWHSTRAWTERAATERAGWDARIDRLRAGVARDASLTYAQVVGVVNDASGPEDYVIGSSGGIPGELHGGWRAVEPRTGGPTAGAAMARGRSHPDGLVTALLGDGSYLMLNSDLYSAAFTETPFVAVVADNDGYAVIHRLQTGQGARAFNNLLTDAAGPGAVDRPVRVDFAAHAAALGCAVEVVRPDGSSDDLRAAYLRARA